MAQIINRDVRSYNYVAVATARRQAEDARDAADQATDARRLGEIKAVRAAQDSRAAERKLAQDQAAWAQSQANDAAITAQLNQIQQDISANNAKLAQDQAALTAAQAAPSTAAGSTASGATATGASSAPDPVKIAALTAMVKQDTATNDALVAQQTQLKAAQGQSTTTQLKSQVDADNNDLQAKRTAEANVSDQAVQEQQIEDRSRENAFRQQVASEHVDPDTYAPAKIGSLDPVRQVSVSVIGEGEIQLRGPIKGINVIRTMIDQIDAPVGQVRVGIHTVQINGEHGDRMERVAGRIQDYIDHSRFLTVQSGQLLRNAIVTVASRLAKQAQDQVDAEREQQLALCPDDHARQELIQRTKNSQWLRDQKYVRAFFGEDFISELEEIDSEFLMSGNKLLSLHSMDSTSLASALFLLALAKNEVREEILTMFEASLANDLPQAEANYFEAGAGTRGKDHFHKFTMLACNAKFQSLRGFFNAHVAGNETINPLQREFIRLAQIFKSRLVTELELNQRIRERGLIEQRLGNYLDSLRKQQRRQQDSEEALRIAQTSIAGGLRDVAGSINAVENAFHEVLLNTLFTQVFQPLYLGPEFPAYWKPDKKGSSEAARAPLAAAYHRLGWTIKSPSNGVDDDIWMHKFVVNNIPVELTIEPPGLFVAYSTDPAGVQAVGAQFKATVDSINTTWERLGQTQIFSGTEQAALASKIDSLNKFYVQNSAGFAKPQGGPGGGAVVGDPKDPRFRASIDLDLVTLILEVSKSLNAKQQSLARSLRPMLSVLDKANQKLIETDIVSEQPEVALRIIGRMIEALNALEASPVAKTSSTDQSVNQSLQDAETKLRGFIPNLIQMLMARRNFEASRRPLDHKKLLDMLIDDVQEKYIDLLEGVRSHTANIDAYIKAVATALDDDFNTQYYFPTFAEIRKASRFHDVTLADVETTNVLANNRGFARVDPTATMEFDLPKRDILINEAMNGALAMTKDFGALVNDPTFLSMAKLRSGQPTSSLAPGAGAGVNTVRNTLPGLSRSDDENLFSQQGAGRTQFGSAMEALIPDPAVYKFETGTGFQIRPVIQPDGQSIVFHFNYMYTTNVREPVRADEKHLGRVKRHFIDTDVQLGNYELREVSRYQVALKVSRTSRGIPLFEDIPGLGILFRPLPSAESSLQENIVMAQSTIFPTLFDLMGLRWAPAVADLDTLRLRDQNFTVRKRNLHVTDRVFDVSSASVDEFLRIPAAERRPDLYRSQETIPDVHPNGYRGPGLNYRDSHLREGYDPTLTNPPSRFIPSESRDTNPPDLPGDPNHDLMPDGSAPSGMPGVIPMESPGEEPVLPPAIPASPGLGLRGAPARRQTTPMVAARPGAADRYGSLGPVQGSPGTVRQDPGPVPAATPRAVPATGRTGVTPSLIGPASAAPPRTTVRPGPAVPEAAPRAVDNSVSRSSFTVSSPTPARPTVPPPATRGGTPSPRPGGVASAVATPHGPSTGKTSGTAVAPDDKPDRSKRWRFLNRLRGTDD
ncbi:MAG TPA: hypothetical protein VJY33_04540 [Isosphaeraceae bacterium]|nr:hypothetical protein [Isosphaeraceae bacterium]